MAKKSYTDAEREATLTVLQANGGNLKRTARETGVSLPTLRDWKAGGKVHPDPVKAAALGASYLERVKAAREAAMIRMLELIPGETDLFKVTGAVKVLSEVAMNEEVLHDALRDETGVTASPHAATAQVPRSAVRLN